MRPRRRGESYAEENSSPRRGGRLRRGGSRVLGSAPKQLRGSIPDGDGRATATSTSTISATGNPNAVVTVQVGSQVSGIVMALYADFNTKVTKGQLIARLDPASLQTKVDRSPG